MKLIHDLKLRRSYRLLRRCNFCGESKRERCNKPQRYRFLKTWLAAGMSASLLLPNLSTGET